MNEVDMGTIIVVIVIVHHRPRGPTERPSRLRCPLFRVVTHTMPSQQVPSAARQWRHCRRGG
jgi:hypothetical protein